jgi:hypothetical protein
MQLSPPQIQICRQAVEAMIADYDEFWQLSEKEQLTRPDAGFYDPNDYTIISRFYPDPLAEAQAGFDTDDLPKSFLLTMCVQFYTGTYFQQFSQTEFMTTRNLYAALENEYIDRYETAIPVENRAENAYRFVEMRQRLAATLESWEKGRKD